ncbi:hypothetical protein [Streptomyces sp. NPDC057623]|uniref:hypothetical protein n=1 Tax=Streptomyces sp. NPDC057623 TaxID=3346187 RepID=UPI003686933F
MFVRRSTYNALKARYEHTSEQLGKTREKLVGWKGSAIRVAGRNTELARRLEASRDVAFLDTEYAGQLEFRLARVLTACVRYRADLAAETRRADRLQRRLDDALGLNTAGIELGSGWQDRREDKRVRGAS